MKTSTKTQEVKTQDTSIIKVQKITKNPKAPKELKVIENATPVKKQASQTAKKETTQLPKFKTQKEAAEYLKGLNNEQLFKFGNKIRVTWTKTSHEGINRMRCMMAIKAYYKMNLPA